MSEYDKKFYQGMTFGGGGVAIVCLCFILVGGQCGILETLEPMTKNNCRLSEILDLEVGRTYVVSGYDGETRREVQIERIK